MARSGCAEARGIGPEAVITQVPRGPPRAGSGAEEEGIVII